ncbi:glycoside hydrolase family 2 protein [Sciscionella sediminilitoris]|uniref:glycoside hydrolase family 2 protein n=1 Tax=Sciscionella sediminilitoris TaxID=1445613 RepID=UPI001E59CD62|nr:glycoside hydrolase family 2 TIM barrel-domain containing protein [Sciscionella sp. SE31]
MTESPKWSRRRLLAAGGIGLLGLATAGPAVLQNFSEAAEPLGPQWFCGPYQGGPVLDTQGTPITLPHCPVMLSWRDWRPTAWERTWVYRCRFDAPPAERLFLDIGAALTSSVVYLNGQRLGSRIGGYLPYTLELTELLGPQDNELVVVVDGRWQQNVPPNRPHARNPSAIDFYQPAGMYRPARLRAEAALYVRDVFAKPVDVLDEGRRRVEVTAALNTTRPPAEPVTVSAELLDGERVLAAVSTRTRIGAPGEHQVRLTLSGLAGIRLWDVEAPELYRVRVRVRDRVERTVRIGFREARFREDGFYLNGRRLQLFGLNRHQWYPYTGGAMPDRVQRKDAEILRGELGCNMVRCSHYPQSEAFLDACDELGLLVWEEAPGWDYLGDVIWRARSRRDVRDMVLRDRNHPSIIIWGTRLNETGEDTKLYTVTDEIAERLDGTRPTSGAVRYMKREAKRARAYASARRSQDVFAYNDYSDPRTGLQPPRADLPYLVTEAVGAMIGPGHYRRTDAAHLQSVQALLHAAAHDAAASDPEYCGLLAWCAFDYPSSWKHSIDAMKWAGVCDFFRIPKLGAAFYRAQRDPEREAVVEPGFYWDFGKPLPEHGPGRRALIYSNCETLTLALDDGPPRELHRDREQFPHLRFPPFRADLEFPGHRPVELRLDGLLGGRTVVTRRFSADRSADRLEAVCDDGELRADGADASRLVLRAVDRFGAQRTHASGDVLLESTGPVLIIGDNPFPIGRTGGAGAV